MESLRYLDLSANKLGRSSEGLGDLVEIAPLVFALPNRSAVDWSKDTAVLVSAQVQSTPSAQITLTWPLDPNAAGYRVYRKSKNDATWGTPVATIGYSTRLTQNNQGLYRSEPDPTVFDPYQRNVHIALMGDPTLRMHVSAPPSNIQAEVIPISSTFQVRLTWNASPDANLGYIVERIDDVDPIECSSAGFFPLHSGYVTTTTFLDEHPFLVNPWPGPSMYRVLAVQLITSASGSYHNTSQGVFITVGHTGFPPC